MDVRAEARGAGPSYLGRPGAAPIYIKPAAQRRATQKLETHGQVRPLPPLALSTRDCRDRPTRPPQSSTAGAQTGAAAAPGSAAGIGLVAAGAASAGSPPWPMSGARPGPGSGAGGRLAKGPERPGAYSGRGVGGRSPGPEGSGQGRGNRRCSWRRDPLPPRTRGSPAPLLSRGLAGLPPLSFSRQGRRALRSCRVPAQPTSRNAARGAPWPQGRGRVVMSEFLPPLLKKSVPASLSTPRGPRRDSPAQLLPSAGRDHPGRSGLRREDGALGRRGCSAELQAALAFLVLPDPSF